MGKKEPEQHGVVGTGAGLHPEWGVEDLFPLYNKIMFRNDLTVKQ